MKNILLVIGVVFTLGGCASSGGTTPHEKDPFERFNRSMLKFNLTSDALVLQPVAQAYSDYIPDPARSGVRNFFNNLKEPMTVVNDILQGKLIHAAKDTSRFVINTVFGFFGTLDIAAEMNLPRRQEDFGQSLAVWGVPSGPYLVLPFFGPSTFRDTIGSIPDSYADALLYLDSPETYYAQGLRLVDGREALLGKDELLELQADKYLFLREVFSERRNSQIEHDGNPPPDAAEAAEDALIEQILEE